MFRCSTLNYRIIVPMLFLILVLLVSAVPAQAQSPYQRCFPETGYCISGRIYEYWQQNGGLPVFGLPITRLQTEVIEGRELQVQWFERNRLELHPDNPAPYDVLLGRLGSDLNPQATPESPQPGCRFFEETGFNVCGDILATWRANGLELDGRPGKTEAENLALFGLPLSGTFETTLSDGQTYTVQIFERARFELHPQNAPPFNVLLGQLGREVKQPELPGPDAEIVATVRASEDLPGFDFTVVNICIDGEFAMATVLPVDPGYEAGIALLKNESGQWNELYVGPGFPLSFADARESYGIPDDFACMGPPIDIGG